jgi:murein L,D-transpeptidase YafK
MNKRRFFQLIAVLFLASFSAGAAVPKVDKVLILKKERKLILLSGDKEVRSYRVALGRNPVGAKTYQGDNRTPEGFYTISGRNAVSTCHRSLRISYPNADDSARAKKLGKNPGGDIFIHGLPNGQGWIGKEHVLYDWTFGCIAVTDEEIEEIWKLVPNGTVVEIRP